MNFIHSPTVNGTELNNRLFLLLHLTASIFISLNRLYIRLGILTPTFKPQSRPHPQGEQQFSTGGLGLCLEDHVKHLLLED